MLSTSRNHSMHKRACTRQDSRSCASTLFTAHPFVRHVPVASPPPPPPGLRPRPRPRVDLSPITPPPLDRRQHRSQHSMTRLEEPTGGASPVTPAVLAAAEEFVRKELAGVDASHDYWHIGRVRENAKRLAADEGLAPDAVALVDLAALLHDVKDWKYSGSDGAASQAVEVGRWGCLQRRCACWRGAVFMMTCCTKRLGLPGLISVALRTAAAQEFLISLHVDPATVARVLAIIKSVGFKEELGSGGLGTSGGPPSSLDLEARIVQDADRYTTVTMRWCTCT